MTKWSRKTLNLYASVSLHLNYIALNDSKQLVTFLPPAGIWFSCSFLFFLVPMDRNTSDGGSTAYAQCFTVPPCSRSLGSPSSSRSASVTTATSWTQLASPWLPPPSTAVPCLTVRVPPVSTQINKSSRRKSECVLLEMINMWHFP